MKEMIEIAATIWGNDFPDRTRVGHDLYACLERACPQTGTGPAAEEDRQLRYLALGEAVLDRLRGFPNEEGLGAGSAPAVPEDVLREVLRETRREVEQWCRTALFWSQADVIPWYDRDSRSLYVDGRLVYRWSGHAEGGPQLTVLQVFQEEEWAAAIDCPLPTNTAATDTCKKLNNAVGEAIHFSVAGEQIRWEYPWRRGRSGS